MAENNKFEDIFNTLKEMMLENAPDLVVHQDTEDVLYLHTPHNPFRERNHDFGRVNIKKNYVSFHLMALYTHTEMLEEVSEALKKRMQGKSCFNFKKIDEELFEELRELIRKSYTKYQEVGYI